MILKGKVFFVLISISYFNFFIGCQNGSVILIDNPANPINEAYNITMTSTDTPPSIDSYPGC